MKYAKARGEERKEEKAFRLYISDSLFYYMQNMRLVDRYADLLTGKQKEPQKSGDEIVSDIFRKHNFRFKK